VSPGAAIPSLGGVLAWYRIPTARRDSCASMRFRINVSWRTCLADVPWSVCGAECSSLTRNAWLGNRGGSDMEIERQATRSGSPG